MISVQVRTELGEILCQELHPGVGGFFEADRSVYPMLVHVVPWGDTAFNKSQVSVLLNEINAYESDLIANPGGESFDWLRQMIHLVMDEPHRMLWFVGD